MKDRTLDNGIQMRAGSLGRRHGLSEDKHAQVGSGKIIQVTLRSVQLRDRFSLG